MEDRSTNIFGEHVYRLRAARGWTLREAASAIGLSHSRLTEIEAGIDGHSGKPFVPAYVIVVQMAKAYGVPTAELLALAGHEPLMELASDEVELMRVYRGLDEAAKAELRFHAERLEKQRHSPSES